MTGKEPGKIVQLAVSVDSDGDSTVMILTESGELWKQDDRYEYDPQFKRIGWEWGLVKGPKVSDRENGSRAKKKSEEYFARKPSDA